MIEGSLSLTVCVNDVEYKIWNNYHPRECDISIYENGDDHMEGDIKEWINEPSHCDEANEYFK